MFVNNLIERFNKVNSKLCIGLDPEINYIREMTGIDSVFEYNKEIIDRTNEFVLCYKPQIAHYSANGLEDALRKTIEYVHNRYPDIPVILDSKRNDIGNTAKYYVKEAFERYNSDAVTVNPYMGTDAITPFIEYEDNSRGVIILAKTSNSSSDITQGIETKSGIPFYLEISKYMDEFYRDKPNLLFVVGGTDLDALSNMRQNFPNRWFLIPGIGVQGGNINSVIKIAKERIILNVTRGILYPQEFKGDYFNNVYNSAKHYFLSINEVNV